LLQGHVTGKVHFVRVPSYLRRRRREEEEEGRGGGGKKRRREEAIDYPFFYHYCTTQVLYVVWSIE
jgi:hypothetical protein